MNPKRFLFVCVENSCRSQIAEAFARKHGGAAVEAWSAGSKPSGTVNPTAILLMKEKGIDLNLHQSKGLDDLPKAGWDCVVTMGCGDQCPFVPAQARREWQIPDPKHLPLNEFRKVRDRIERHVLELIREGKEAGSHV